MAEALDQVGSISADAEPDQPREKLAEEAVRWMAGLPEALRPRALPERFPHMVNKLCRYWHDVKTLRAYLDDLLIDHRGNRRGLPLDVADELAALKDYFETVLHPVPQTVWDEVAERTRIKR